MVSGPGADVSIGCDPVGCGREAYKAQPAENTPTRRITQYLWRANQWTLPFGVGGAPRSGGLDLARRVRFVGLAMGPGGVRSGLRQPKILLLHRGRF